MFHFDSCDESESRHLTALEPVPARADLTAPVAPPLSSHDATLISEEKLALRDVEVVGKGKGVTRTFPIPVPMVVPSDLFDMHSSSLPSTSRGSNQSSGLLLPLIPSYYDQHEFYSDAQQQQDSPIIHKDVGSASMELSPSKGKERESPPVLPPLAFSPTDLCITSTSPLSSSPSSGISYTSSTLPLTRLTGKIGSQEPSSSREPNAHTLLSTDPTVNRPRSLSSVSSRSSRSRSLSQLRSRLASSPSSHNLANLACNFVVKKPVENFHPNYASSHSPGAYDESNSPSSLWRRRFKVDELDNTFPILSGLQLHDNHSKSSESLFDHTILKRKGRSYSSQFPPSALDIVPSSVSDVLIPIPLVVKNYFDEILPHELRLHIFATLVNLHETDHLRATMQGRWSVSKASSSRNRWVGRNGGVRELVKLSRVSKSWQALAFDGQLWTSLDLHSFPSMAGSLILRFTAIGGQYIRTLDISGNTQMSAATLLDMSDHLCVNFDIGSCYTQLTVINLQGCAGLTTRSLHHLLSRSRRLQKLCVKGLKAVTNTTCSILSTNNTQLVSLDISRCISMDARGIESMATAALNRGDHLLLKELRVSGLRNVNDDMMTALGKAAPYLEVLDLSYARQLHNSAVDAFVACGIEQQIVSKTLLVPPRDLGRSDSNESRLRRRVTRLRHLSLSNCVLLTDDACSNLTFSVPNLEFLELSGIGTDLKDDGLIRLLNSTPYIRRIDLEDASQITDAVLDALTPSGNRVQSHVSHRTDVAPETGHALEQLIVSFAVNLTNGALLSLVQGCTRLKSLEADNTHINSTVLKEFVRSCQQRGIVNAKASVVDCRGVSENTVKDLAGITRPRMGWRAYEARKLMFLDARDGNAEELKVGQDECDEKRVVLKSFYSWQMVDNVKAAREKRRKSKRMISDNGDSGTEVGLGRPLRWWSPGGRRTPRTSGRNSPLSVTDFNRDGCTVM
ncbi:hypothetical protein C0993_001013 [Termitomyces sp. T159_Od127]|nr:hypothetical protein C0993_001013 [Termitomyces sp. T159_Od127]